MTERTDIEASSSVQRSATPDLMAPVFAFRDWRVDADGLWSPRTATQWTTRAMEARCHPRTSEDFVRAPHVAPGHDCGCGIHAYFTPRLETFKVDHRGVTGIVTVFGAVEVHASGVRAQWARVEALGIYGPWTRRQKDAVRRVAAGLGVDSVDTQDLPHVAHRYGTGMPETLIPRSGPAPIFGRRPPKPARRRLAIVPA